MTLSRLTIEKDSHISNKEFPATWLTTHPQKSVAKDLSGASGPEGLIASALFILVDRILGRLLKKTTSKGELGTYEGWVYCQIHHDNLRIFRTIKGESRNILPPALITRPISTLTKFVVHAAESPRVSFTFSDNFVLDLYSFGDDEDLGQFRETLNALLYEKS